MHLLAHTNHSRDTRTMKWQKLTNEEPNGFMTHQVKMGLHMQQIIPMYWYTTPSQYCPWFHNTSHRQFPVHPNVVPHGMQNK
jgi:hypothetical protein